jgi:hypothetical protein
MDRIITSILAFELDDPNEPEPGVLIGNATGAGPAGTYEHA